MSNIKSRARKFADLIGVNRIVDDTATALATTSGVTVEETLAQKMSVANTQALSNARLGATASVALTGDVTGTGSFSSNSISITTDISNSGVTAGTYGSSSQVPSFTVASDGRITSASQVAVAGVSSVSYTSANNNLRVATSDGTTHDVTISTTDKMSVANTIALANARLGATAGVTLTGAVTGTGTFSGNSVSITTTATSDPTITLAGDLTGSVTLTNLGNGTLTASVVDDSHNHIISNVDGLQTALNTKATWAALIATNTAIRSTISSEVASLVDSAPTTLNTLNELAAALGDNPNFATTLTTNLGQKLGGTASITLNGDVSGSGSFSANAVTITTTVADDSHNHIIGNVDGLQAALNTKMSVANTIALANARLGKSASVTLTGAVTGTGSFSGNSVSIATTATADPTLTLAGDCSGSATFTNLGNATLTVTVANDSHTHDSRYYTETESNTLLNNKMSVANTQALVNARLGAAASITLTGAVTGSGSFSGNSVSIATTATADPTLTLTGDVTGSATFTNLGNATLTATVADDSHNHIISNVDGLQTALDAKLASSSYTAADVLTKIKTVDGSGSGLDADTVDGLQASSFLRSDASTTNNTDIRAPIFYDSNDTSYYVDAASTSVLNSATIYGSTATLNIHDSKVGGQNNGNNNYGDYYSQILFKSDDGTTYLGASLVGAAIKTRHLRSGTGHSAPDHALEFWTSSSESGYDAEPAFQMEARDFYVMNGSYKIGTADGGTTVINSSNYHYGAIFYDSNNTAYYTDPAGNSVMSSIELGDSAGPILSQERDQNLKLQGSAGTDVGITGYDSSNNWRFQLYGSSGNYGFLNANWSSWDLKKIPNGNMYLNNNTTYYYGSTETYMSRVYGVTDIRSPIFYDNNNTAYYGDFASTSVTNVMQANRWQTGLGYQYAPIYSIALAAGGTGFPNGTWTNVVIPGGGSYGLMTVVVAGGIVTSVTLTNPGYAYYDNNGVDCSAVLNTASTGTGSGFTVNIAVLEATMHIYANPGVIRFTQADSSSAANQEIGSIRFAVRDASTNGSGDTAQIVGYSRSTSGGGYLMFRTTNNGGGATQKDTFRLLDGDTYIYNSTYAYTIYDWGNTAYYVRPSSTSLMATIRATSITAGTTAAMTSAGQLAIGGATNPYISFHDASSATRDGYLQKLDSGDYFYFGECSYVQTDGSFRSPIFYDSNNTSYYVDAASTSFMAYIGRRSHSTGFLVGSYNSVGANNSKTNPIYTIGSNYNPGDADLVNMYGIGYSHPNAAYDGINTVLSGWGLYVAADGDARVGFDGSNGHIKATGNIVAYASDGRLKTNVKPIENALQKISKIRGVSYDWVDNISTEYGFNPTAMHEVGVIAQEIQEVLPEVVTEAPFNGLYTAKTGWSKIQKQMQEELGREVTKTEAKTEYNKLSAEEKQAISEDHKFLTVDYERITPLLIEAIKELNAKVEELEQKLNSQK